ncbi:hypothetical protein D044_3153A, partial [Vibrio parahaemolyticus EKP-026]
MHLKSPIDRYTPYLTQ